MRISEHLEEFAEWGAAKYAPRTVSTYSSLIRRFVEHADDRDVADVGIADVVAYHAYLRSRNYADSSVAYSMLSLRQFFRFLFLRRVVEWDYQLIPVPRYVTKSHRSMEPAVAAGMINGIREGRFRDLRDKAMLSFLYATGVRVSELCALSLGDVGPDRMETVIVTRKNRVRRIIFWDPGTHALLRRYLAELPLWSRSDALWITLDRRTRGRRLGIRSAQRIFNGRRPDASYVVHSARHGMGTDLAASREDIRSAQKILGHLSIRSTQTYSQLSDPALRESYDRMWRDRREGVFTK